MGHTQVRTIQRYALILRDIKELESHGSMAHVANIRFLINANHAAVGNTGAGSLKFMHSSMKPHTPADQLYQPVHRLLVEEHVFAFSWSPVLSKTYYAVMAAIAAAKLASSVASTVASFGATTPALIDAIGSAASTMSDIIKLGSAVKESASVLAAGAAEAYALGTEAYDMYTASRDPSAAAAATSSSAAIGGSVAKTDLASHTASNRTG